MADNRKWLPKPEILMTLKLWEIVLKFQRKSGIFEHDELHKSVAKWLRQQWRAESGKIGAQNVYIAIISGCRSLSQSPSHNLFELGMAENNSRFAFEILVVYVMIPEIFSVLAATLPF